MKCWWTMLIPRSIASDGPAIVDRLAVEQDLPLVRARQTVEDVHEGRLAGAVLAQQGVDLAAAHVQVDVVVGDDPGIALGDAPHLERGDGRCSRFSCHDGLAGPVTDATSGPARRHGPLERLQAGGYWPVQVPHWSVQVLRVPAFIAASAVSSLPWTSAGRVMEVLWNGE